MATEQNTIDFLLDQLARLGGASTKKMFGEYCLYLSGKPVGLVCDDQLFLKPTKAGASLLAKGVEASPYPGAKPHLLITPDQWEDPEWDEMFAQFTPLPGARQIFDVAVDLVQSSCGFAVPYFDYAGDREMLAEWAQKKGPAGIRQYWIERNRQSLDGMPTHIEKSGAKD